MFACSWTAVYKISLNWDRRRMIIVVMSVLSGRYPCKKRAVFMRLAMNHIRWMVLKYMKNTQQYSKRAAFWLKISVLIIKIWTKVKVLEELIGQAASVVYWWWKTITTIHLLRFCSISEEGFRLKTPPVHSLQLMMSQSICFSCTLFVCSGFQHFQHLDNK